MASNPVAIALSEAMPRLLDAVAPVRTESASVHETHALAGRVLAEPVALDRDSPACDVSAMDGFAVRIGELAAEPIPLAGECRIGEAPAALPPAAALRIYTGCPLPEGADTVVRLERGEVSGGRLSLLAGVEVPAGADIRRRGENALAGSPALAAGCVLGPAAAAALATIGPETVSLFRRLRVVVITTGNELDRGSGDIPPWRLRDSNGPSLVAMLAPLPWVESIDHRHADDSEAAVTQEIQAAIDSADAVVLTGGVSKGAYDFVPGATEAAGGTIVFHRMKARPGQPTLGAIADGKPIVGLPGNPLSVLCAGRRVLVPALRKRAGIATYDPPAAMVTLSEPSTKRLPLVWWRPVSLSTTGAAVAVAMRGSGDVIGPAVSDGFIEIPPETAGTGPYAFYPWTA